MPSKKELQEDKLNERVVDKPKVISQDGRFIELELPSGSRTFKVRPMLTKDENSYTYQNKKDVMAPYRKLLGATTDISELNNIQQNDIIFMLCALRRISYGDWFKFQFECSNPNCSTKEDIEVDLADLDVLYSSEEMKQTLISGGYFECVIPSNKKTVKYRMPVFGDFQKLANLRKLKRHQMRTASINLCIMEIETEAGSGNFEKVTEKMIGEFEVMDTKYIEAQMSRHSVGIVTTQEVECIDCGADTDVEIPLEGADFLMNPSDMRMRQDGSLSTLSP